MWPLHADGGCSVNVSGPMEANILEADGHLLVSIAYCMQPTVLSDFPGQPCHCVVVCRVVGHAHSTICQAILGGADCLQLVQPHKLRLKVGRVLASEP